MCSVPAAASDASDASETLPPAGLVRSVIPGRRRIVRRRASIHPWMVVMPVRPVVGVVAVMAVIGMPVAITVIPGMGR